MSYILYFDFWLRFLDTASSDSRDLPYAYTGIQGKVMLQAHSSNLCPRTKALSPSLCKQVDGELTLEDE